MTIGSGNTRIRCSDVIGSVRNGDRFVEDRLMMQRPQRFRMRRYIPLMINNQLVNVSEEMETRGCRTTVGTIYRLRRVITVSTADGSPLLGVNQSDVVCALRVYDAQQAATRRAPQVPQVPQVLQALQGSTIRRGRSQSVPSSSGVVEASRVASTSQVAAFGTQASSSLQQTTMQKIEAEYQNAMRDLSSEDVIKLIRMQKGAQDLGYRRRLEAIGAYPNPEDVARLAHHLPMFVAYNSLREAWERSQELPAGGRAVALQRYLVAASSRLSSLGSTQNLPAFTDAAGLLNAIRARFVPRRNSWSPID